MKALNKIRNKQNGYSLMEVVVVLVIIGIVGAIAYGVVLLNARTFKTVSDKVSNRWEVRKAMDVIRNDLQDLNPKAIFGFGKGKNANKKFYFVNNQGQKVRYQFKGNKLLRRVNSGKWEVVLDNVKQSPFEFLDGSMNPTTNSNDIAYIRVNLAVNDMNPGEKLEDVFFLRNRYVINEGGVKEGKEKDEDHEKDEDEDDDHHKKDHDKDHKKEHDDDDDGHHKKGHDDDHKKGHDDDDGDHHEKGKEKDDD